MGWGFRTTDVDLVQGHVQLGRKLLLDVGARLVLLQEMVLEDIVLVLGEAGLDVAAGLLLRGLGRCARLRGPGGLLLRVGRVHGGRAAHSDRVASSGIRRCGGCRRGRADRERRRAAGRRWQQQAAGGGSRRRGHTATRAGYYITAER